MKKIIYTLLLIFSQVISHAQIDVNSKADSIIIQYLSSKSWAERTKYVILKDNTLEAMEERYSEFDLNAMQKDSTSSLSLLKAAFTSNKDPWIKVKGFENYYKKKAIYYLKNGFGVDVKQSSNYFVYIKNNSALIDWEASIGLSEITTKSFDLKKAAKYYSMRVNMELCETFYDKDALPDYYCVKFQQDDGSFSENAIISKTNANGLALYEQLSDGKAHSKVIWIRYASLLNRDETNSYKPVIEDLRIIGYINSVNYDSWLVGKTETNIEDKISLEDKNLQKDIEKFNSYIKNKSIIESANPNLKTINSAKTEYFDKQTTFYGYLKLDDYFNWGYNNSQETHYSFKLNDGAATVQIYFSKGISKELFDKLKSTNQIAVKIIGIPYKKYQESNFGNILIEGVKYEILK